MSASARVFSFPKGERGIHIQDQSYYIDSLSGSRNNSPSPGQYDIDDGIKIIKEQSPEWTFSRTLRPGIGEGNNPGPGQYDGDISKLKGNISFTMGTKPQNSGPYHQQRQSNPGPGMYEPTRPNKSPSFTLGGKVKEPRAFNTPGPGQYELQNNSFKMNQGKKQSNYNSFMNNELSKSQRASTNDLSKLGPGAYTPNDEVTKYKNPTFGFGKGQKGITSKDLSPGPGKYDNQKQFGQDAKKVTLSGRPKTSRIQDAPGPGQYDNLNKTIGGDKSQRGISSMRSKGERIASPNKDDLSKPGPGAYDGNKNVVRERTPDFKFGTSQRASIVPKEEVSKPGPGYYEIKNKKTGPSAKMGKKIQQPVKNDVPGPGNYNPNHNKVKDSVRNVKISKDYGKPVLSQSKSSNCIGPGQYYVTQDFGKTAPKVSIKGRPKEDKPNNLPGPGGYDPNDNISKERIRSAIIKGNPKANNYLTSQEQSPGPGNYYQNNNFAKDAPSFTIKGRQSPRIDTTSPGPGAYDARDSLIKSTSVTYKQSQSQRQDIAQKTARDMPGPGQYTEQNKQIGKNGPKFTMGKKEQKIEREKSPGPGVYEPNHNVVKDKVKNINMGKSRRADITLKSAREMPGPGIYDNTHKTIGKDAPSFTIKGRKQDLKIDEKPGPGAYDARDTISKDRSPQFRMGSGQRTQILSKSLIELPGPGTYDTKKNLANGPQYSFKPRNEPKTKNYNPGPGNYDPNEQLIKEKIISYKMGSGKRASLIQKDFQGKPGPGAYESPERLGKNGPQYSMGGRSKSRQEVSPGPGQYDPIDEIVRDKSPHYKMSSTQRDSIVSKSITQLPGPGTYTNSDQFGQNAMKIQIRGRQEERLRIDSPGPGAYEPSSNLTKDRVRGQKIDEKSRRADIVTKEMLFQPGPGEYDSPVKIGWDVPSVTIKGRPEDKIRDKSPGPGKYDQNDSAVKERVITYKMASSQRQDIVSKFDLEKPGPGIYEQTSSIGKHTYSYSMAGKPKAQQDNKIPGPGTYEPKDSLIKDTIKSQGFSKSPRQDIVHKETRNMPGPGNYTNEKEFGKDSRAAAIRGRPQDKIGNDIPGPGNYEPSDSHSKDRVIAYKIGSSQRQDIVNRESIKSPGPGAYDSPSKLGQSGPKHTFKGRNETPTRNDGPGPGQYDLSDSVTRFQSPAVKISDSKSQRGEIVSGEKLSRPGPGTYDQPSNFGKGNAFAIRGKPSPERINDIPGPGTYDANASITKDRIQTAKIGKNRRDFLSMSNEDLNMPGPGNYDVKHMKNSVSYSMGGKERTRASNNIPGPGTYDQSEEYMRYKNPSIDFSRSPDRLNNGSPRKDNDIGPGQYDSRDYNIAAHTSICYTIPKGEIKQQFSDTPGPGYYKLPAKFADVPSYANIAINEDFKYV